MLRAVHVALVCVSHALTVPLSVTRLHAVWFAGSLMTYCIPSECSIKVFIMIIMYIIKLDWRQTNTSSSRKCSTREAHPVQHRNMEQISWGLGAETADICVTYNAVHCIISSYLHINNLTLFTVFDLVQKNDWMFLNIHYHREDKSSVLQSNSNSSNRSSPSSLITISASTHAAKKWDVDTHANKLWRKKMKTL